MARSKSELSRPLSSVVLGYHGCDREDGECLLSGATAPKLSSESWHWLGAGVYFWEGDPLRALEWAKSKAARNQCKEPFVIGAVIDLGNCFDLQVRENFQLLQDAYASFEKVIMAAGRPMPVNRKAPKDQSESKVLRYLDCAVIDHLHKMTNGAFDTVRGIFTEGNPAYPGGGMYELTHSQIAVRNLDCIKGMFRLSSAAGSLSTDS